MSRRRLKARKRDRISDLPPPILHRILSSLSQIDAVKTCVLSKSWRYLWYGRPVVEFCKDDFKGLTVEKFVYLLDQTLIGYQNQNLSIQKLRLHHVPIEDETFERLFSSCPLIEEVSLNKCEGLKTIKVNINHSCSLKHFEFRSYDKYWGTDARIEIGDVSSIEAINFKGCWDWFEHHKNNLFAHLKSLRLSCVKLTTKSVDIFSCNFPCLEELELMECCGEFEEFQLSSRTIKRFAIEANFHPIKVSIDAPNIFNFEFKGYDFPSNISFTTTPNRWKSKIHLTALLGHYDDLNEWLHELDELLKVLSRSETSLQIVVWYSEDYRHVYGDLYYECDEVVKHLELCLGSLCSDYSVLLELESGVPKGIFSVQKTKK